jgi:hypothetical protein
MRLLAAILVFMLPAVPASAEYTIGQVLTYCLALERATPTSGGRALYRDVRDVKNAATCLGYIGGVIAGVVYVDPPNYQHFCIPEGVTENQLVAVYLKFARAHPEWHDTTAARGIIAAMQEAFPCPK